MSAQPLALASKKIASAVRVRQERASGGGLHAAAKLCF
jgi:hypothetical protein